MEWPPSLLESWSVTSTFQALSPGHPRSAPPGPSQLVPLLQGRWPGTWQPREQATGLSRGPPPRNRRSLSERLQAAPSLPRRPWAGLGLPAWARACPLGPCQAVAKLIPVAPCQEPGGWPRGDITLAWVGAVGRVGSGFPAPPPYRRIRVQDVPGVVTATSSWVAVSGGHGGPQEG